MPLAAAGRLRTAAMFVSTTMKPHLSRSPVSRAATAVRWGLLTAVLATATRLPAQFAYFGKDTDTIAVSGGTNVSAAITIEAVFILTSGTGGTLYFEQRNGTEHKQLATDSTSVSGFALASFPTSAQQNLTVSLNTAHHLAFVQNSGDSSRRLFFDGTLVFEDFNGGGLIANDSGGPYPTAIGASTYETSNVLSPSFVGYLDSIRVSNTARYTTNFSAPTGDLSSDAATLLLYNFSLADISGNTVADLSGNGLTGTFGTGFAGATSPVIATPVPEPAVTTAVIAVSGLGLAVWRRRRSVS